MTTTVYTVIKDGIVEHTTVSRKEAMSLARNISGLDVNMALADVQIYESVPGSKKPKIIWSVNWESQGPLEPNVYADTPSLVPSM